MAKLLIEGLHPLQGKATIHGAKNSVLPILAATILADSPSVLHNCPGLSDVNATIQILRYLGCKVEKEGHTIWVDPSGVSRSDIPTALMREMRSSIIFLGAIAAKMGQAKLSLPGGCELGPRPIDLHLKALRAMGLEIDEAYGYLDCKVCTKLQGAQIALAFPSVGATENIMLAAALAEGTTVVTNAAQEPEIVDLANFLNGCGAKISGAGEGMLVIEGVKRLAGCEHTVIPDRIEAITFLTAAATAGGDVLIEPVELAHLSQVIPMFEEAGCRLTLGKGTLRIQVPDRLNPIKSVRTMPYPGFPTDAQAPVMAMMTLSKGTSVFVENIFESRYKHAGELARLGANIKVEGRVAVVEGVKRLYGASVVSPDLRGGAALLVAGLGAEGVTELTGLHHIDRGYENLEDRLNQIGAVMKRI